MIFVKDKPGRHEAGISTILHKTSIGTMFRTLIKSLRESYKYAEFKDFLKAAFLGMCALNTMMLFMSVYATMVFGLSRLEIVQLLGFSILFALVSTIASGFISDAIGYRKSLIGVYILWVVCLITGGLIQRPYHWLLGALVGTGLGATWVIFRALVVKIVPSEKLGEMFGVFNVVGYLAGVVGPLFWGLILLLCSSMGVWRYRIACLSLTVFIAFSFVYLLRIYRKNNL